MAYLIYPLIDIVAVTVLVFGLYFPRHRRRDLVVAYLGVNVGVLAVATSLSASSSATGLGLGLALFGVLSIIRLRSTELEQHEVAYYFCALALGILSSLSSGWSWRPPALMALLLVVMYLGDHPRLLRGHQRQVVVLDAALTDHHRLVTRLEQVLGARVRSAVVQRLDLVNDTTIVDVRYQDPVRGRAGAPPPSPEPGLRGPVTAGGVHR